MKWVRKQRVQVAILGLIALAFLGVGGLGVVQPVVAFGGFVLTGFLLSTISCRQCKTAFVCQASANFWRKNAVCANCGAPVI
jgi:hypothetical protein